MLVSRRLGKHEAGLIILDTFISYSTLSVIRTRLRMLERERHLENEKLVFIASHTSFRQHHSLTTSTDNVSLQMFTRQHYPAPSASSAFYAFLISYDSSMGLTLALSSTKSVHTIAPCAYVADHGRLGVLKRSKFRFTNPFRTARPHCRPIPWS